MGEFEKIKECFNCYLLITDTDAKFCPECKTKLTIDIPKEYENMTFEEIEGLIRNELSKFEYYLEDRINDKLEYFDFKGAFAKLFIEAKKFENYKDINKRKLIESYANYLIQHSIFYDKGEYSEKAVSNDVFIQLCDDIDFLCNYQLHEFNTFFDSKDFTYKPISINSFEIDTSQPHQIEGKLSLRQIALIHAYSGEAITDHNKNDIAIKNGWTSGHKLKQLFDQHYYRRVDRIGLENTLKKTKNKIGLIESIINLLPKDKQQQALDEVQSLEKAKNTGYL